MERSELISLIDERLEILGISAAEASRRATGNHYLIRNIKKRDFNPSFNSLNKLCSVLGVELAIHAKGDSHQSCDQAARPAGWQISDNPGKVQLYGYAGAGGEIAYDGEFHHGEVAPAPPGNEKNLAAVEVRGDSASPYLREGDIVYFYPDYPANPHQHVGRMVLATTVDGAAYIKILRNGDTEGKWNLQSINPRHPLMEDVELQRISPFVWIHYNGRENQFQKM